jgi:phage terminase large subunit
MQQAANSTPDPVAWAQAHPVEFIREAFDAELWHMQKLVIESVRDNARTAVRSCHGIGKSFLAAHVALWFLLTHPYSLVATTAPTFRQVKKILWQEIAKATAKAEAAKKHLGGKQLKTEYIIAPGWFAFGFSSDDATAAQGLHARYVLLIYDEASGIPEETYEALEGALTSEHTRLLEIGNPTDPTTTFAKEFKLPGTSKFAISAFDTPNFTTFGITLDDVINGTWEQKINGQPLPMPWLITPTWVADKVKRWGVNSPAFKARVMAEFPDLGDNTLISLAWLDKARQNEVEPEDNEDIELSVDVARFGGDEFVIGKKHGYHFRVIEGVRGISTVDAENLIMRRKKDTKAKRVKIDGGGMGIGIYDHLKAHGLKVVDMQAGGTAIENEEYVNARAEWFWNLRKDFEAGLFDIDEHDDDLYGQLSSIRYAYDSKGRIKIESKDDMKKRGLQSPDRADAMAMAYGPKFDVRASNKLIQAMRKT